MDCYISGQSFLLGILQTLDQSSGEDGDLLESRRGDHNRCIRVLCLHWLYWLPKKRSGCKLVTVETAITYDFADSKLIAGCARGALLNRALPLGAISISLDIVTDVMSMAFYLGTLGSS